MSRNARTFSDHLRELRLRLFVSFVFFVAGGVAAYLLNVPILQAIQHSLHQTLYYTTPAGAFNLAMKISFIGGAVFVMPALTYNAAAFVQPALTRKFTKFELRLMTMLTLVLAALGAAFAYYLVVPMSIHFFQKFDVKGFQTLISATEYVNFVINCVLIFIIMFQIPQLLLFIDRVRPLPPKTLWKFERYVVVGSLVIALILPFTYDPLTQFLIALPMIALYNFSILLIMFSHKSQKRRQHTPDVHQTRSFKTIAEMREYDRPPREMHLPIVADVLSSNVSSQTRQNESVLDAPAVAAQIATAASSVRPNRPRVVSDIMRQPTARSAQYQRRPVAAPARSARSASLVMDIMPAAGASQLADG